MNSNIHIGAEWNDNASDKKSMTRQKECIDREPQVWRNFFEHRVHWFGRNSIVRQVEDRQTWTWKPKAFRNVRGTRKRKISQPIMVEQQSKKYDLTSTNDNRNIRATLEFWGQKPNNHFLGQHFAFEILTKSVGCRTSQISKVEGNWQDIYYHIQQKVVENLLIRQTCGVKGQRTVCIPSRPDCISGNIECLECWSKEP